MKSPGNATCGGLVGDSKGNWAGVIQSHIGDASSLAGALWALRDGLHVAGQHKLFPLDVETDAEMVHQMNRQESHLTWFHE